MSIHVDIAGLLSKQAGAHLARASQFHREGKVQEEIEASIQAVILFQTAMEAIINEEVYNHPLLEEVKLEEYELNKRYKSLSFKNKWKKAFEVLQIKDSENLDAYLAFYSRYRSPISHPRSRYLILDSYSYATIIKGIEHGWYASQLLFAILGKELTSWEEYVWENIFQHNKNVGEYTGKT